MNFYDTLVYSTFKPSDKVILNNLQIDWWKSFDFERVASLEQVDGEVGF